MRKWVNHKDKTLQALKYLDPKVAMNGTVEMISPLEPSGLANSWGKVRAR